MLIVQFIRLYSIFIWLLDLPSGLSLVEDFKTFRSVIDVRAFNAFLPTCQSREWERILTNYRVWFPLQIIFIVMHTCGDRKYIFANTRECWLNKGSRGLLFAIARLYGLISRVLFDVSRHSVACYFFLAQWIFEYLRTRGFVSRRKSGIPAAAGRGWNNPLVASYFVDGASRRRGACFQASNACGSAVDASSFLTPELLPQKFRPRHTVRRFALLYWLQFLRRKTVSLRRLRKIRPDKK